MRLLQFTRVTMRHYEAANHHLEIAKRLEAVERGEILRLMIAMPPRHGKSELVSIRFPAWYLGRNPDKEIIHVSYSESLSRAFSRATRNLVESERYRGLFPKIRTAKDARSVEHWRLEGHRGGFVSAGVGSGITGKGADLVIIDDPLSGAEAAGSEVQREKLKQWYVQELRTRLAPGAAIVICSTRWHEADLTGMLKTAEGERRGERWDELVIPAEDESKEPDDPTRWLWPQRFTDEEYRAMKVTAGPYTWSALFQQRPVPVGGGILKREWFKVMAREHVMEQDIVRTVIGTDLAIVVKKTADFSVAMPVRLDSRGFIYLYPPYHARSEWPDTQQQIYQKAMAMGASAIAVEQVSFQNYAMQSMKRSSPGACAVLEVPIDGDKVARINEWAPLAANGRIWLVEDGSGWTETFLREAETLPFGRHDDLLDAASVGIAALRRKAEGSVVSRTAQPYRARAF